MSKKNEPPTYKSEAWLMKMGWSKGDGLGKERAGRVDIVTVVKKDDSRGLGKQNYDLRDFSHWDDLFNKAAKKLDIHEHEGGVTIKKAKEEEKPAEVKATTSYGGMFVKATSGTMSASKREYRETDLFKICGSRELRLIGQSGKHDRISKFDKGELNYTEPEEILSKIVRSSSSASASSNSDSDSDSDSDRDDRKKKKKSKKSKKAQKKKKSKRDESSSESSSEESAESSSDEKPKQKSKSKSKKSKKESSSEEEEEDSSESSSSSEEERKKKKSKSKKRKAESESDSSSEERPKKKKRKE